MRTYEYRKADGKTHEDNYSGWLDLFRMAAQAENGTVMLRGLPTAAWRTLAYYLGAVDEEDRQDYPPPRRHEVEAACATEPVLVDALWKADNYWGGDRRHIWEEEFIMATYSSFWRPEILSFMERVKTVHTQKRDKCVLVPCAADKPYPAPLHKAVREVLGDGYEIIVVSSAVGPAPEDLWDAMPRYDAGLPYFERVYDTLPSFFKERDYFRVINYTDMLQWDINKALSGLEGSHIGIEGVITPVLSPKRGPYLELAATEPLRALARVAL